MIYTRVTVVKGYLVQNNVHYISEVITAYSYICGESKVHYSVTLYSTALILVAPMIEYMYQAQYPISRNRNNINRAA